MADAGPYAPPTPPLGVPSLVWFCVSALYRHPDQLHLLGGVRLNYRRELNDIDLYNLDPRLWATLVQLYDRLPDKLSAYQLPLNDTHLPLLQEIPSTPSFSLLTILDLPACKDLDDATIINLKPLHSLVAFDASSTALSTDGIQRLTNTLLLREPDDEHAHLMYRGPWPLRILRLRNCAKVTNDVYPHLAKFPLLSIIDLRNTACRALPPGFTPASSSILFHPTPLLESLNYLQQIDPDIHSSTNPYSIYISEWGRKPPPSQPALSTENTVVVFSTTSNSIKVDNANCIALKTEAREERERHARNKAAWYERNEPDFVPDISARNALPRRSAMSLEARSVFRLPAARPNLRTNEQPSFQNAFDNQVRQKPQPSSSAQPSLVTNPLQKPQPSSSTMRNASLVTNPFAVTSLPAIPPNPFRRNTGPILNPPKARNTTTGKPSDSNSPSVHPSASKSAKPVSQKTPMPRARAQQLVDEDFMLYRDPPPWSALQNSIDTMAEHEARRKRTMKITMAMRKADFASVERDGKRAAMVKSQIDSLVTRRQQVRNEFALSDAPCGPRPSGSVKNPFAKRHSVDGSALRPPRVVEAKKILKPISTVQTPEFTQDLLDTTSKQNQEAAKLEGSLERSASISALRGKAPKRQTKQQTQASSSFDWKKWSKVSP